MSEITPLTAGAPGGLEHFDVLIVGAGISGIGAAHHLGEKCPGKRYAILESKESYGGTWRQHTYPGIRSDSDLYTFGYGFKPWTGQPIASGDAILDYLGEAIDEDHIDRHIRYRHEVLSASWSAEEQRWMVTARRTDSGDTVQFSCTFLWMCQGYYRHSEGYTPRWEGMEDFKGPIVHPQTWPEDLDYRGKRVVVIGSGATAATLIPNMADDCEHITMLQRSPTYFWTGENRNELADQLRELEVPEEWVHEIVRRSILKLAKDIQYLSVSNPEVIKEELFNVIRSYLGEDFDMRHFTPSYRPWQQRLAYVPDGDLFEGIKSGKVSVVTDHIERFAENGIITKSGELLEADIIITATGFNLSVMGDIDFDVDGEAVDFSRTFTYRGIMNSGVPNMAFIFGYLRTSWTMRVDLVCDFVCKLLNHMDELQAESCTPTLRESDRDMAIYPWIDEEEFNPGYMQRGKDLMPKRGDNEPWTFSADYYTEREQLPLVNLDDDTLVYRGKARAVAAAR
ncbi:MAG: SidA/IucD/PvdA family monooxygenase [Haliea sp.]|jgi:cation diffusion facilitator CzcD-associated flavoprotein CzcO|nr:SidA/IucD/PvdA family monooxygenase [Haliea sp.]